MAYDPITGAYATDEKSDEQIFAKAAEIKKEESDSTQDTQEVDTKEEFKEEKVAKLNKKAILIALSCAALLLFVLRFLHGSSRKHKKAPEKKQASDIIVPEFGNYKSRAYKGGNAQTTEQEAIIADVTASEEPARPAQYEFRRPQTDSAPPVSSAAGTNTSSYRSVASEEEMLARKSAINAPINNKKASQTGLQAAYGSSANPSGGSANDYLAQRLNNLNALQKTAYESQNMQDNKQSFYEKDRNSFASGYYLPKDSIWSGTVIPAVLLTGITTDLPGQIKAQVSENVYDSSSGTLLLIPQGSVLIAEYNSSVSYSQKRVQIAWNTLIRPDGYQLNLGNMNGVDNAGFSGVRGWVDEHLFEYVKAMGIITAFTAINGEFDSQVKKLQNQYAANLLQQNQTVINQLGAKLIDRALDIQPSIFVNSGKKVNVFVNKPLILPIFKK